LYMVTVEKEKTTVMLDELRGFISIRELYPPVVYSSGSNIHHGFSGQEKVAAEMLLAKLNYDVVMSESQVKEFMMKVIPSASEQRVETLVRSIHKNGGMTRKDVIIGEEGLEEYFKYLIPHRVKSEGLKNLSTLKARGIDPQLATDLSFYKKELLKPFLDEPRATNELVKRERAELREWRLNEDRVMEYSKFGVFGDDIKKFGTMVDISIKHFRSGWRKHAEMLAEVFGKYGLDVTHSSLYTASREVLELNLELCMREEVDVEEVKMLSKLNLKPPEFEKELRKKFKEINLRTCKERGIDLEEVEKLLEMSPKKFDKELEGIS
jgi:hypothetical protein